MKKNHMLIVRILFGAAFLILFLPVMRTMTDETLNAFSFIFGKTILAGGYKLPGHLGLIFLILIPIAYEVISVLKQNLTKLLSILLSAFGLIMTFVFLGVMGSDPMLSGRYGQNMAQTSSTVFALLLIYPAIIVVSIIFAAKNRKSKDPKAVGDKPVSESRGPLVSEQTKERFAKFSNAAARTAADVASKAGKAAVELGGKAKEAASTLAASDVKKASNVAEQLKMYKDLLDGGVITQEEFDAKKKEILGQ
jgi:hypothetical protein